MTESLLVAVPVYNEEEVLPEFVQRVTQVFEGLSGISSQVLFVDDGSTDGTRVYLEKLCESDSRFSYLGLSRNFGHQAALSAAIDHAHSDILITMDGDLQDPPELIPKLIEEYRREYDVVYTYRASRDESWVKKLSYFLFYRIMDQLSSTPVQLDSGDFSLFSRRATEALRSMKECHRYYRGLRSWVGYKQLGVAIERPARAAGVSKYSLIKLFKLALDGIFSFSLVPLRFAYLLGGVAILFSTLFAIYSLYIYLTMDHVLTGFTATIFIIIFSSGIQLIVLGVIGEYVGRTFEASKARPPYIIEKGKGVAATCTKKEECSV